MKQLLHQKRETFHSQIRRQKLETIMHEKRWHLMSQQVNNEKITFESLTVQFTQLEQDILEGITSLDNLSDLFSEVVVMKQNNIDLNFSSLEATHFNSLEVFTKHILKNQFQERYFQTLLNMTYIFGHRVCSMLIFEDIFPYLQKHHQQMIPMTCRILSNIFVEDQTIKLLFQHKVYKHQFYTLINEICVTIPGNQLRDLIFRIGTNSFSPHSMIIECFSLLLKYSMESPAIQEALSNANRLVDKNHHTLNQPLFEKLSQYNVASILHQQQTPILNIILTLLQYQHKVENLDKLITSSFINSLEQTIKSKHTVNQIIAIKIISSIARDSDLSHKIIDTTIIETLIKFLHLDCFKVKDEILQTIIQCLKCPALKMQLMYLSLQEVLVPLLNYDEQRGKTTIILTLKCLKNLYHNNKESNHKLKQQFQSLNGLKLLEAAVQVDDLAEEILEKYFND